MTQVKKVLVTGANGQLGKCLQDIAPGFSEYEFTFVSREALDIENLKDIEDFFKTNHFHYCVNAAAYTNVEKAESDAQTAYRTNAEAAGTIAAMCAKTDTVLIHISTDYVFDGKKQSPYTEEDEVRPINVYGASKLKGEELIRGASRKHFLFSN